MRVLFITRKYPPAVGGMEQLSYHVITGVGGQIPTRVVKWGGSQKWLPLFLIYALGRALSIILTERVDVLHFSDLVLAPLALLLRQLTGVPVAINAHGLDIQYPNRLYQALVPACARKLDVIICNSASTRRECLQRGVLPERAVIIPPGVGEERSGAQLTPHERDAWRGRLGLAPGQRYVLFTVGRLVPRKGVYFFISEVARELLRRRQDWVYVVIGEGSERHKIEEAIRAQQLEPYVRLLGQVDEDALAAAYAAADLFVMPNVPVPGDSEGFGMVSLEARMAGLPVVAANLEGIVDSLSDGQDGELVTAGDSSAFVAAICEWLDRGLTPVEREGRRQVTLVRHGWPGVIQQYVTLFERMAAGRRGETTA